MKQIFDFIQFYVLYNSFQLCHLFLVDSTYPAPRFEVKRVTTKTVYSRSDSLTYDIDTIDVFWPSTKIFTYSLEVSETNNEADAVITGVTWNLASSDTIELAMRGFENEYSNAGYRTKGIVRFGLATTDDKVSNNHTTRWTLRVTDNPALDNGEDLKITIEVTYKNQFHFVYQDIVTTVNYPDEKLNMGWYIRPERLTYPAFITYPGLVFRTSLILHSSNGKQRANDITLTMRMRQDQTYNVQDLKDPRLKPEFFQKVFESDDNRVQKYHMKYLELGIYQHQFDLTFTVSNNDYMYSGMENQMMIIEFEINFCPYSICSASKKMDFISGEIISRIEAVPFLVYSSPFRLKFIKSGQCLASRESDNALVSSSTCRTQMQLRHDNSLRLYKNQNYSLDTVFEITNTESRKWLYHQYMIWKHVAPDRGSIILSSWLPGELVQYEAPSLFVHDAFRKNDSKIKFLEVPKDIDDIILKSALYVEADKTLYLCNPGGDFGNRRNCFYTSNFGNSWKGLPSAITFIVFKKTSANVEDFYGKCFRGRSYCRFTLHPHNDLHLSFLTKEEFLVARFGGDSIETFNLDDQTLTRNLLIHPSTELIAVTTSTNEDGVRNISLETTALSVVTALGVHVKKETGIWKQIFYWGY